MLTLIYAWMIKLYPRKFKYTFEDEMKEVFAKALENAKLQGNWAPINLLAREIRDLPIAVIRAYYHEKDWTMPPKVISIMSRMVLIFLIPLVVATMCNFAQWNYFFIPPSLDPMVAEFSSVDSLGYYDLEPPDDGLGYLAVNGDPRLGEYGFTATASQFIVDYDMYRPARWAQTQGIDRITRIDEHTLGQVAQLIQQLNWPIEVSIGTSTLDNVTAYSTALFPVGYVIRGQDEHGNNLMLVSMVRLISDDSYGYHEALFQISDDGNTLLETNDYNYDNAGVEFAQWPFWFLIAFLLWYVLILIGHLITRLLNSRNTRIIVQS